MDYISREDAVTAIVKMSMGLMSVPEEDNVDNRGSFSDGLFLATNVIHGLPSSDVIERRKGRWVKWGSRVKCDQCNLCNSYEKPYCPNCGADMRGEQDE